MKHERFDNAAPNTLFVGNDAWGKIKYSRDPHSVSRPETYGVREPPVIYTWKWGPRRNWFAPIWPDQDLARVRKLSACRGCGTLDDMIQYLADNWDVQV